MRLAAWIVGSSPTMTGGLAGIDPRMTGETGLRMMGLEKGKLPLPAILASSARRFVRRFGFGKTKKFSVEGLKRIICRYLLRV